MTYFQGFVVPVKAANKQAYLDLARKAAPVFREYGATRVVECWGDDVMAGKVTDFRKAVQAADDENVAFSWIEWPDRATCDGATGKLMADERMTPQGPTPFDGARMIYAGFDVAYEAGDGGACGYVDGIVASVPDGNHDAFVAFATATDRFFVEGGALRTVDGWGADVPDGTVTDFKRAVQAEPGETVVFGWIEWTDKASRDAAFAVVMDNAEMRAIPPAWNGSLAIFGGFVPILDTDA